MQLFTRKTQPTDAPTDTPCFVPVVTTQFKQTNQTEIGYQVPPDCQIFQM